MEQQQKQEGEGAGERGAIGRSAFRAFMRRFLLVGVFVLAAGLAFGQRVTVEATVNARRIGIEDVLELTVSVNGGNGDAAVSAHRRVSRERAFDVQPVLDCERSDVLNELVHLSTGAAVGGDLYYPGHSCRRGGSDLRDRAPSNRGRGGIGRAAPSSKPRFRPVRVAAKTARARDYGRRCFRSDRGIQALGLSRRGRSRHLSCVQQVHATRPRRR